MQSLFRALADGDTPTEASRFRERERLLRLVVDALVTSDGGTDQRARNIIGHWSLLLQDGCADLLFGGAPLLLEQQKRAAGTLGRAISAARAF